MPFFPAAPSSPAGTELPIRVLQRALAEAREALGMDAAYFAEFTADELLLRAVDGDGAPFGLVAGMTAPLTETYCARMVAGEIPCWVPDTAANPVTAAMPLTGDAGLGAYVGVPVRRPDGRIFGSLCCVSATSRPDLDERDARVLHALAGVVASQLEQAHRYHEVLETREDPVWVTDLDGRTVFANEPLARLLGADREALLGGSSLDYVAPWQLERLRAALELRASGRSGRYEIELVRADGSVVPVEVNGAPLTDDAGEVIGRVATLADLTERREAERLSDARFRWLADLVPQQIWIAAADGRIEFLNDRVETYFGHDVPLAHMEDWAPLLHPEDAEAVGAGTPARETGEPYEFRARMRRHDGAWREHLAQAFPLLDEDGGVLRWYGVSTDLTDAHAQERLLRSEAQLREAQRIARLGAFRWERGGAMAFSEELLDLLELTPEAFGGSWDRFLERVHPEDRELVAAQSRAAKATGEPFAYDHRLALAGGQVRVVHAQGRFELDADGEPLRLAGTVQDVTDQRSAESALRGRAEAERASRAKSEFLSRMSHELRTPLNAILGFGQLLELDPLTADQQESVGHVLKAGAHLLQLINEVLEISRIEAGALRLSLEPVRVGDAVQDVVALVTPLAAERGIDVVIDLGPEPDGHVRADLQRLKQVLLNLLSNAIKYNREGGLVTVRARAMDDGRTRLVVSDTGPGLGAGELKRAFSPFERLTADQGATEGTGLGLALSRSLAEAMGGEVTAASELGCGCDFSLMLATARAPRHLAPQHPGAATAVDPDGAGGEEVVPARRRVLYVEDNLSNLRLVERVLERAGIEVLGAPQGRLGIELARRHRPDLVLLDLDLPDISGEEVLATLAAAPATAAIPVVVCSADANPATIERVRGAGACKYLTKPLDVKGLLKAVAALTDEAVTP